MVRLLPVHFIVRAVCIWGLHVWAYGRFLSVLPSWHLPGTGTGTQVTRASTLRKLVITITFAPDSVVSCFSTILLNLIISIQSSFDGTYVDQISRENSNQPRDQRYIN